MWQMIAALAANKMQQAADEARQRQQTGAQMKADYAASLTGGPQSYHAPPPPANSQDLSSLFSLMNPAKTASAATPGAVAPVAPAAAPASSLGALSPELIDPWAERKNQQTGY